MCACMNAFYCLKALHGNLPRAFDDDDTNREMGRKNHKLELELCEQQAKNLQQAVSSARQRPDDLDIDAPGRAALKLKFENKPDEGFNNQEQHEKCLV